MRAPNIVIGHIGDQKINIGNISYKITYNYCPKCGQKIDQNWKVCPYCTTTFKEYTNHKLYCTNCGKKVKSDWKVCPYCNEKI